MSDLNDAILEAHANNDEVRLVALYTQAANETNDVDTACFFLTYAYIYALELGLRDADTLYLRLDAYGRV
ncbi:MAG: hypothetical protein KC439_00890 [Yoonia sp.]|jgi:hypothetical protein|nr:hypothetical protein [Yoonia sp.]